ncbi:hypothetical protein Btru_073312 [Bulinus truncatus]|nr:hypothetical protein Btru_073312 [Bulinus truncatus]
MSLDDLVQLTFYGQGIGVIVGSTVGGMVADMLGRRRLLYFTLTGMLTMHCLLAVSISWVMFIFLRILAVAFAGATMVVSSVMVIEFLGPDWRDACTCSCFWTFGAIVLSMETLVTLNWRWLALLSGGICFPLIGTYFTSTESVRWLQCQHRFTEAEACFREVVSVNAFAVPDIMSLLDESRACIVHNMHHKRFTYLDLFHSVDSAKWTVTLSGINASYSDRLLDASGPYTGHIQNWTHSDLILDTSGPYAGHIRTVYRTHLDHILDTSGPYAGHIQTVNWTHSYRILDTFGPFNEHIRTVYWTHPDRMLNIFGPYTGHSRTVYWTNSHSQKLNEIIKFYPPMKTVELICPISNIL